jgi:type II secretory pathway pseudopilin PulG
MNPSDLSAYTPRLQRGAASVAIAMLILLILAAAIASSMITSGSSVRDAAAQEEQTAALFLAESGVERAQAAIVSATQGGSYDQDTCKNIKSATLFAPKTSSGTPARGTFQYTDAVVDPPTCSANSLIPCASCTITVVGKITGSSTSRTLRTALTNHEVQGIEGYGSQFTLELHAKHAGGAAFTNLAYAAKDAGGGSNAQVGACINTTPGGTCTLAANGTINGWNLQDTGVGNVSGMGVYASVPTVGNYSVTTTLVDSGGNNLAPRVYVQVGALFYPTVAAGSVSFLGSYGANSHTTLVGTKTTGDFPSQWNCAPASDVTGGHKNADNQNSSFAAVADTLVYGFSSLPQVMTAQADHVTFGIHPLRLIFGLMGTKGGNMYSEIWYSYNPAYYSTGATGSTNGATFTGASGAQMTAAISVTTLTATSFTGGGRFGELRAGDLITVGAAAGTTIVSQLTSTEPLGALGQKGTYQVSISQTVASTGMNVSSDKLRVTNITSGGVLTPGDTINISGAPTILNFSATGTTGNGLNAGDYVLSARVAQFAGTAKLSSGKTIALSGATGAAPSDGTAIADSSGTGIFDSATVTGSISGTTLTVTGVTSGTLQVGDAIFGRNIQPLTRIVSQLTGTTGGVGTYTVNNSQEAASDAQVVARAAVNSGSATVTGSISSGTTLMTVTAVSSGTLKVGNAISYSGSLSNTRIMSQLTSSEPGGTLGLTGTYTVCRITGSPWACGTPQAVASTTDNITGAASATFYTVSRTPTTNLSGLLCGGVCAFFFDGTGPNYTFSLSNITPGDTWSSGLACLSGVDPTNVTILGHTVTSKTAWSEPIF